LANNNRNSSSSSFYGSSGGSANKNNGTFKSNSQSTFDMFNINVKDAQKKVTAVFDFTKGKIKENEKASTKSINKIFDVLDSRIKNSAGLLEHSFSKAYAGVGAITNAHVDAYSKAMDKSLNTIVTNTQNKYKTMYSNLDRQHENYTKKVQAREKRSGAGAGSSRSGSSGGSGSSTQSFDIRRQYNESQSGGNKFNFSVNGIADAMKQANNASFEKSLKKAEQYYAQKLKNGDITEEQAQKMFNRYATESSAAQKANFKNGAIEIGTIVVSGLMDIIGKFFGMWLDGAQKFSQQYEASYNQLSTAFASDRDGIHNMLDKGMNNLGDKVGDLVNYSDEFLPALTEVSKQGLMGDNALAKAIRDSVDKKIMPWLDTASEQWVNMNTYLSEGNLNTLKGQQLMLQKTEAGNRLLQSGVINSVTNDMEPLLRNIDFNTGGSANMSEDAQALMASMVENGGMTPQEAYEQVKAAVDVQKNQYAALTSGDTSKILMAQEAVNGGSYVDMLQNSTGRIAGMAADTGSDLGASAVGSILGLNMSAYTNENAAALEYSLSDKAINDMKDAIGSGKIDPNEAYGDAINNASEKITTTQEALNSIENSSAETLGLWSTQIPLFWTWAGSIASMLGSLVNWGLDKLLGKLFNGGFKGLTSSLKNLWKGAKNLGSKAVSGAKKLGSKAWSGIKTAGSTVGKLFTKGGSQALQSSGKLGLRMLGGLGKGGLYAGGASTATAAAAGLASGVVGAVMTAKDAVAGVKKSKEWLGDNKTGSKVAAGIGGALGGTGPGVGEGSAKDVAKNTGKNALKGAAIGAAIGTVIPGVGTAIGGAVGAGVGALTGLIGGKRIAKATKAIGGAFKKAGKGIAGAVSKGAKAVGGALKKTSLGKTVTGIMDVWKDDSKSLGQKLTGSVGAIVKNNPLVKIGKSVGGALSKGAKSILNAAKNSKIGKAATSAAKKIGSGLKNAAGKIADKFKKTKVGETISKAADKVKNSKVGKAVSKTADKVKSGAKKAWKKIKGWFASGSDEIPYDGYVAKLHKGETVFNAKATKAIKKVLGITSKSVGESPLLSKLDAIKQKLSSKVKDKASDLFDKFKDSKIGNKLSDIFGKVKKSKAFNKASEIFNKFKDSKVAKVLEKTPVGMIAKLGVSQLNNAVGAIKGSFASGIDSAPEGNAILHKGEMVTDAVTSAAIKAATGITAKSVDSPSSVLDKMRDSKEFKKDSPKEIDEERIIKAIGEAATRIVKAVNEDEKSNKGLLSRLQGAIGKVKVAYDESIVKLEPITTE